MAALLIQAIAYGKGDGVTVYFSVTSSDGIPVEGVSGDVVKAKFLYAGLWRDIATTLFVPAHMDPRTHTEVPAHTFNFVKSEGLPGLYSISAHPSPLVPLEPHRFEDRRPYVIQIQVAGNMGHGQAIAGGTIEPML